MFTAYDKGGDSLWGRKILRLPRENAFILTISLRAFHCHRVACGYVSLASQNSRTNARDGYTDMKK